MAIQLIDNFYLNVEKPIDNRFVVGGGNFYLNKNDITNKYPGLRIWDLNDSTPYVWDGISWINENTSGVSGSGTLNRISKFTSTGGSIGDSQIFDNGTNVGIGTITPSNKLSVSGNVSATNFIGNGSQLTSLNINSSNVNGKIGFNNLPNGTNNFILKSTGTSTEWVDQSSLNVGSSTTSSTSTTSENVNILGTSDNSNFFVLFSDGAGTTKVRTNVSNSIRINPSNGRVSIGAPGSFQNRLSIDGGVFIGPTTITIPQQSAPTNGLRVHGDIRVGGDIRIESTTQQAGSGRKVAVRDDDGTIKWTNLTLVAIIDERLTQLGLIP